MLKYALMLFTALAFSAATAGEKQQEMIKAASESTAWVYDLPGSAASGGNQIRLAAPVARRAEQKRLSLVIVAGTGTAKVFETVMRQGQTLPLLRIVERAVGSADKDTEYRLTNARVISVEPLESLSKHGQATQQVILGYERIQARMGVSMNPGPPADAPTVKGNVSTNLGWIYPPGHVSRPIAVVISSFTGPEGSNELRLRLGGADPRAPEIDELAKLSQWQGELILVLPDKRTLNYVEFKMRDGVVTRSADEIVFRSNSIDILEGTQG